MKYKNFINRCILMCMLCMSGLTGYAAGYWLQQAYCYQNRALSVGATVYLK